MIHQTNDKTTIEQILDGNKQAYTLLVKKYQQKVFRLCMGFLHNPDDADDLTQEIFIKVYHKLSSFRGEAKFSTWLYRIAANMAINFQRKQKLRSMFYRIDKEAVQIADNTMADDNLQQNEQQLLVKKTLNKLPPNQRKAIILSHYDELSNKEVAVIMGLSLKACESLLFRARQNMQKILKQQKTQIQE